MAVIYFNSNNDWWKATNNSAMETWLDSKPDAVTKKTISDSDYLDFITGRKIPTLSGSNVTWTSVADADCSWNTLEELNEWLSAFENAYNTIKFNNPELSFLTDLKTYLDTLKGLDMSSFTLTDVTIEGSTEQRYVGHNFDDVLRRNGQTISFSTQNFA